MVEDTDAGGERCSAASSQYRERSCELTSVGAEVVTICICKITSSGKMPVTLSAMGNGGDVTAHFLKMLCIQEGGGGVRGV